MRAGARTSSWLEPPSLEAIRSGCQSASIPRRRPSELREVRAIAELASVRLASSACHRGGASWSSATSQLREASQLPNSSRSGRFRQSRERQVCSERSGGKSRPWARFQLRTATTMPG